MPTALIIGASRGIGRELARQYRSEGWNVIATARKPDDLAQLSELGCHALPLDVNNLNDCAALGWRLDDEKVDTAILNAGVSGMRSAGLQSPTEDDFNHVMHTNVLAAMRVLPILLPILDHAGGKLAVLSSRMGSVSLRENPQMWLYRASKAALNSVLKDVSLSATHAVCLALHPGWVRTDMGGDAADLSVEESVTGLRKVIANAAAADNGKFFDYSGQALSW
jgi:NAD(P)-dependent dehydrogenase (short-subunit alcohol dehydrogenase family)